jgi:hypothetical protein
MTLEESLELKNQGFVILRKKLDEKLIISTYQQL